MQITTGKDTVEAEREKMDLTDLDLEQDTEGFPIHPEEVHINPEVIVVRKGISKIPIHQKLLK